MRALEAVNVNLVQPRFGDLGVVAAHQLRLGVGVRIYVGVKWLFELDAETLGELVDTKNVLVNNLLAKLWFNASG